MCADMCVGEEDVAPLLRCVRVDLDCAAVCTATVSVVSRRTEPDPIVTRTVVAACAELCGTCAEECERHAAHHAHCRVNAATCRRCEQACQALLGGIG
jgi:hypothetical protein